VGGYTFVLIFIAIFITYLITNGGATTWNGVMNILRHSAVVGIMAYGMGLVILTGDIDLSVGAILPLVGGLSVMVFNATDNVLLTLCAALAMGAVCGLANGVLVGLCKDAGLHRDAVHHAHLPLAVPVHAAHTGPVHIQYERHAPSYDAFYGFGQSKVATIPSVGLVFIAGHGADGLHGHVDKVRQKSVYAVGSNEQARRGLPASMSKSVRVKVFTITGVLCGLSAFLWLAMNGSVDPPPSARATRCTPSRRSSSAVSP
jgi:ribose transport system permease protein